MDNVKTLKDRYDRIRSAISIAASRSRLPVEDVLAIAILESGLDPGQTNGRYRGLFQLSNAILARWGSLRAWADPIVNASVAAQYWHVALNEVRTFFSRRQLPLEGKYVYAVHNLGGYSIRTILDSVATGSKVPDRVVRLIRAQGVRVGGDPAGDYMRWLDLKWSAARSAALTILS